MKSSVILLLSVVVVMLFGGIVLLGYDLTHFSNSSTKETGLHQLVFIQQARCPYGGWLYPWAVTLSNGQTKVNPQNASLNVSVENDSQNDSGYSEISFIVPSGTYGYTIIPATYFSQSGNVTVSGSDASVQVFQRFLAEGCSSVASSSSTTKP